MNADRPRIDAVLFDLDGTLLDSAPDLHAALERLCAEEGVAPPPYESVRPVVSRGARAVLRRGFAQDGESAIEARVARFLDLYREVMAMRTRPFDGIEALLRHIENSGRPWGVVTNKMTALTEPLLDRLDLARRAGVVVCGDTLETRKPDPAPVLHACERLGVAPGRCLFAGDDERDVQAGAAAGAWTVAVTWGYLDGGDPHRWGADHVIDAPVELSRLLAPLAEAT